MTPKEIIAKAADLIEQKGWTQGCYARDVDGNPINELSDKAVCFCILGAMRRAAGLSTLSSARDVFVDANYLLREHIGAPGHWNDSPGRTKDEVVSTLRRIAA